MKHGKFILFWAVLLTAAIALAGCGKDADVSGKVEPAQNQTETLPSGTIQHSTEAPETQAPETEATETQAAEPEENSLSLGRLEGGVYTNTYAGFGCELDSSWTFYSAAELQELPSSVKDTLSGSELGDALTGYDQISDMMAECVDDLTTMNVLYQKLSMQERIAYALLSEEAIIDGLLDQYNALAEVYAQAGMNVVSMEKVNVTFLGEPRVALKTTATVQDVDYYTLQLFDYGLGEYSVTTTFASYVEDKTESLLDLFYKVE